MLYDCNTDDQIKQELQKSNEQLIKEYQESDWFYFNMGAMCADRSMQDLPQLTEAENKQEVIKDFVAWVDALRVCMDKGHDWNCDSNCGPDSGSETLTCKRCRETHTHIYY